MIGISKLKSSANFFGRTKGVSAPYLFAILHIVQTSSSEFFIRT